MLVWEGDQKHLPPFIIQTSSKRERREEGVRCNRPAGLECCRRSEAHGRQAVAGLVLRAPVEQMLWAPKTHHDILYRMLRTRQKAAPRRSPESWGAQNVPRNRAGKCRNAAGARTVCAAAGARWEDRRQHSQPAAVSITLCTALPACGREHHPVDSTPGVRP